MKKFIFVLMTYAGCLTCAPALYFNRTYRAEVEVPLSEGGLVALDTGETFNLTPVLQQENTFPSEIRAIEVHGSYIIASPAFRHLWLVTPKSGDEASYEPIELEPGAAGFEEVRLEGSIKTRCAVVLWGAGNRVFVDSDGDFSAEECPDKE